MLFFLLLLTLSCIILSKAEMISQEIVLLLNTSFLDDYGQYCPEVSEDPLMASVSGYFNISDTTTVGLGLQNINNSSSEWYNVCFFLPQECLPKSLRNCTCEKTADPNILHIIWYATVEKNESDLFVRGVLKTNKVSYSNPIKIGYYQEPVKNQVDLKVNNKTIHANECHMELSQDVLQFQYKIKSAEQKQIEININTFREFKNSYYLNEELHAWKIYDNNSYAQIALFFKICNNTFFNVMCSIRINEDQSVETQGNVYFLLFLILFLFILILVASVIISKRKKQVKNKNADEGLQDVTVNLDERKMNGVVNNSKENSIEIATQNSNQKEGEKECDTDEIKQLLNNNNCIDDVYEESDESDTDEIEQLLNNTNDNARPLSTDDDTIELEGSKNEEIQICRLLLIGGAGNGKSATGNTLLGKQAFPETSDLWNNSTSEILCVNKFENMEIDVVECRSLDSLAIEKKKDPSSLFSIFEAALNLVPEGFDAILVILRYENRFKPNDMENITSLKSVLGKDFLRKHSIIVFTCGDKFVRKETVAFENWVLQQGGVFKNLIDECEGRVILFNNRTKEEHKIKLRTRLLTMVDTLEIYNGKYTVKNMLCSKTSA